MFIKDILIGQNVILTNKCLRNSNIKLVRTRLNSIVDISPTVTHHIFSNKNQFIKKSTIL